MLHWGPNYTKQEKYRNIIVLPLHSVIEINSENSFEVGPCSHSCCSFFVVFPVDNRYLVSLTTFYVNIRREEILALWNRIKVEYDECTGCIVAAGEIAADSLLIIRAKNKYGYSVYERCGAQIADMIEQVPT